MNGPDFDDSRDHFETPTQAAVETLDLALVSGSIVALGFTYGSVIWGNFHSLVAIVALIAVESIFVFIIIPHLIAYWLSYEVDALLMGNNHSSDD